MNASVFDRFTHDPRRMGGKPCLREMRVTVGMVAGLVASGHSNENFLQRYPYLEDEDIRQAVPHATQHSEECSLD